MLDITIYIRDPFPFRWEDTQTIVKALHRLHAVQATYYSPYSFHKVEVDDVTMVQAKQIAATLKAIHLYHALRASRPESRVKAEHVEVEILGRRDTAPGWVSEDL